MTAPPSAADQPDVLCERLGAAGVITLNRPAALNAVTHGMVSAISAALDAWERDAAITRIVIRGAGEKAFCAGGDIRQLYQDGRAGRHHEMLRFWAEEYLLNLRISRLAKPYVALIDGIVMGGGVGLSLHGSHRIGGDRYVFAMPEVGIGFFPDVGATHALPRLPGSTGTWLAVTGERVRVADACALGLVDAYVPTAAMPPLLDALIAGLPVDEAIARHAATPAAAPHAIDRAIIDACFSHGTLPAIIVALEAEAPRQAFAARMLTAIASKSPTSMAIAVGQMRRGRTLDLAQALALEFRIVSRVVAGHDFYEGVRALIIDKDNAPRWQPAQVGDVTAAMIEAYFTPLAPGHDLSAPAERAP